MAKITDKLFELFGRKVPAADLLGERVEPSMDAAADQAEDQEEEATGARAGGVRSWMSGHPADGLTPARLASIHRQAAAGEPEAYLELAEDIEERDLHYAGVLSTRKRSVAQLPITVKEASDSAEHKKHAEVIQTWLNDGVLRAALFDMLDAIGKGFSVTEIDWALKPSGYMLPAKLKHVSQRWFTFDQEDGETILLRDGTSNLPLAPYKFIVHRHPSKSGLTIRSGIARVASWAWMFKAFTLKDWAIFAQNYGQPIRVGKYGRGATEAEKAVLWKAVSGIAGDCAAIVPVDMQIDFIEVKSSGQSSDLYLKRADWYDRQISKVVLGQTTTTDAVSGGHAVSQEHRLVQEDIERSDAMMISATINEQLVPLIVSINFGPQDHYPTINIGRPDEIPLKEFSEAFDKLATHGLTASMSFLRDRMGIPEPDKGAELVGGRAPAGMPVDNSQDPTLPPGRKPAPTDQPTRHMFDRLFATSRHARASDSDALITQLTDRLEEDAAEAMDGLIDEVRLALNQATDLRDAATRLAGLKLAPDQLAEAMARGMAIAHLAGQAALIEELGD